MSETRPAVTLERAQRMVRGTFMAAQGRQYAQVTFIDAVLRTWRAEQLAVDWPLLRRPESRLRMTRRNLPPGHVGICREEVELQFTFWWQVFLWVGAYVFGGSADALPSHADIDHYVELIGGETYMSSFTVEEMAGVKLAIDRYRVDDPHAAMTLDEALRRFTIPAFVQADRYWVADPARRRAGTILPDGESMVLRLLARATSRRESGWELTDLERVHARIADVLTSVHQEDPDWVTLPMYRKLVEEYHKRNPDRTVPSLHGR